MKYAHQRAKELGLTQEANMLQVWMPETSQAGEWHLLFPDNGKEDNMLIMHLALEKRAGAYVAMSQPVTNTDHYTDVETQAEVAYLNTRLKNPKPGQAKYLTPTGIPAQPFLSPSIIDAWYLSKPIETLIIVEGALKALKGCLSGMAVIGINGIWGMREAKSKELHPIIKQVMQACKVKNLVYLHDRDCRDISVNFGADADKRPHGFASSVIHFSKAAKAWRFESHSKDFRWFYAHLSDSGPEGSPKGLDDLLISLGEDTEAAVYELEHPAESKRKAGFFAIHDLKSDMKTVADVKTYFRIDTIENFYEHYSDLLEDDCIQFAGSYYRMNETTDKLECYLSSIAGKYVLVGNKYLQSIYTTNSKGLPELVMQQRNYAIIIDHFKREGVKNPAATMLQIPKYDDYANEPDYMNHKKEINLEEGKLLNLSYALAHTPTEGQWPHTHAFLSHIFHNGGDSKLEVGLDMIQMYYTMPKQRQRILSLVSKENETGKTTFLLWLREIFGQNMSIVGNADFRSQFNGYVTKSLVGVDESKIDDPAVIEAIKSLVTNPVSSMNEKNTEARQIVNHVKLIMTTNHIFDFAFIGEKENKWFVLEVGSITRKDSHIQERMKEEIPAFLHFLKTRTLKYYTTQSRFAIPDEAVDTSALKRVKENSKTQLVKMVEDYVSHVFADNDIESFKIDPKRIFEQLFPEKTNKFSNYDIEKTLKNEFDMMPAAKPERFVVYVSPALNLEEVDEATGEVLTEKTKGETQHFVGRPYTFKREEWV